MTIEQINAMLNAMRMELGFKTDAQLARYLDIEPVTLWRWRQGQLDATKQKLLGFLWNRSLDAVLAGA